MENDAQSEVINLLKDLHKKVGYLEKKIDLLSEGSTQRFSKSRSYGQGSRGQDGTRSRVDKRGGRSQGGFSRYKDKHESAFGAKSEGTAKWYDKKKGSGEKSVGPRGKRKAYKPADKKRSK